MRFTPYITAFTVLVGIASALPAVDNHNGLPNLVDRDGTALDAQGSVSNFSPLETRKTSAKLSKAGKLRYRTAGLAGFDDDFALEDKKVWYVKGDSFLAADSVKVGEKIKVFSLSGCSAIFVIGADDKPTTFHITAGRETELTKSAATYIHAQVKSHKLTPKTIVVCTREGGTTNYNDIVKALGTDLAKLVTHKKYNYNPATALNTERWQLVLEVGKTDVVASSYNPLIHEHGQ